MFLNLYFILENKDIRLYKRAGILWIHELCKEPSMPVEFLLSRTGYKSPDKIFDYWAPCKVAAAEFK